jgi:TolA-binding protein
MDLLESAQQALAHEPRRALSQLREHRSAFPRSKFAQEREVLMLEAFLRLHDTAALKEGARAFVARYPKSAHRARVTRLLEEAR